MIQCPLCGTENPIGAIFCRGCREKLNLDDIAPSSLAQQEQSTGKKVFHILKRVISASILIYLLWALVAIFLSVGMGGKNPLTKKATIIVNRRFNSLKSKLSKSRGEVFVFNSTEITMLVNKLANLTGKSQVSGWTLAPLKVDVNLFSDGSVKFILKSNLNGKADIYTTLLGKFYVSEDTGVNFMIISAEAGKFALNFGLQKIALDRFSMLFSVAPILNTLKMNISDITVSSDSISIRLKR